MFFHWSLSCFLDHPKSLISFYTHWWSSCFHKDEKETKHIPILSHSEMHQFFSFLNWMPCNGGLDSHVLGSVGEGSGVLRGRVLRAMRGSVTDHHHDGSVRVDLLWHAEVTDAVIGYEICQVVLQEVHRSDSQSTKLKYFSYSKVYHAHTYTPLRSKLFCCQRAWIYTI